jgi:hypothetical protein
VTVLLVALGAAIGAPLRYVLAHTLDARWPLGTLLVNSLGSLLIGLFASLALDDKVWALLPTPRSQSSLSSAVHGSGPPTPSRPSHSPCRPAPSGSRSARASDPDQA